MINGKISVRLNEGATTAKILSNEAIRAAFEDAERLFLFSPDISGARFVENQRQSLALIAPEDSSSPSGPSRSASTLIAVAIASVSLVLVSIFSYGVCRRQHRVATNEPRTRKRRSSSKVGQLGIARPNYAVEIEDDERDQLDQVGLRVETKSAGWSVSDITSDSGRSMLSITTSRLEKIEEDGGDFEDDSFDQEELNTSNVDSAIVSPDGSENSREAIFPPFYLVEDDEEAPADLRWDDSFPPHDFDLTTNDLDFFNNRVPLAFPGVLFDRDAFQFHSTADPNFIEEVSSGEDEETFEAKDVPFNSVGDEASTDANMLASTSTHMPVHEFQSEKPAHVDVEDTHDTSDGRVRKHDL